MENNQFNPIVKKMVKFLKKREIFGELGNERLGKIEKFSENVIFII